MSFDIDKNEEIGMERYEEYGNDIARDLEGSYTGMNDDSFKIAHEINEDEDPFLYDDSEGELNF